MRVVHPPSIRASSGLRRAVRAVDANTHVLVGKLTAREQLEVAQRTVAQRAHELVVLFRSSTLFNIIWRR